jgi:hypothetical protein
MRFFKSLGPCARFNLPMAIGLEGERGASNITGKCHLLNLPRELRDDIWNTVVDGDLATITSLQPVHVPLVTPCLLLVSRQVRDEIVSIFLARRLFFKSPGRVARTLDIACPRWSPGCGLCHLTHMAVMVGHLSVIPERRPWGTWRNNSTWYQEISRWSTLFCSGTYPDAWRSAEGGMATLLFIIRVKEIPIRSLEIPVAFLFNISVVRQLRRLRDIDLHLAFISEQVKLKDFSLDKSGHVLLRREWLDETGDIDIVLPIYESPRTTEPVAVAPLASLAAAIRREVASTEPIPFGISQLQKDTPLWIEFERNRVPATGALCPPSSGWYRYVVFVVLRKHPHRRPHSHSREKF